MTAKAQEVALDRLLVDRFKGGDEAAFGEIVARYRDRIYAMVLQLLRNREDAEEVTQDAFIRAHRGLAQGPRRVRDLRLPLPGRARARPVPVVVLVAPEAGFLGVVRRADQRGY